MLAQFPFSLWQPGSSKFFLHYNNYGRFCGLLVHILLFPPVQIRYLCVCVCVHVLGLVVHGGFSSCGAWTLDYMSSVFAAFRLSFPMACGILVPQPGIEPVSPALESKFLTTGPPGKSLDLFSCIFSFILMVCGDLKEDFSEGGRIIDTLINS